MIWVLISLFVCFGSSESNYQGVRPCPYPLPSHIEPCVCKVDNDYRIFLTCEFERNFAAEEFDRIVKAFDYNHNIFDFEIDLWNSEFSGQLNKDNVGRLNITYFVMKNVILNVNGDLIQEGAFEGSSEALQTIHIYSNIGKRNGFIDVDKVLSHATPKLTSLKLSHVTNLRSSSFVSTPGLTDITFVDLAFDNIPNNTFSGEHLPNLNSLELNRFSGRMTIQSNAFTNMMNLNSITMTQLQSIEKIERNAFNNLPGIDKITFEDTLISGIQEDSFANLSSLKLLDLRSVLDKNVTYLPRLLTNSPRLSTVYISNSHFENIAKDFFTGIPNVKTVEFIEIKNLGKIVLQDLSRLITLSLSDSNPKTPLSLELRNLTNFKVFQAGYKMISSVSFSEMESLREISITSNKLNAISMDSMPKLERLNLRGNKLLTHSGLSTSFHSLLNPKINIDLSSTNIRSLKESTFRPLIEKFIENWEYGGYNQGSINMGGVKLDCGCDVKWLVMDLKRPDFFKNARCPLLYDSLDKVDPILLQEMCPPDY